MRGKLIMPCGTEKSLTAFWIAEELAAKTVVIAVPSLALVQQTLFDWLREIAASSASLKVSSSNVSPYTVSSSKAAKDPLPGADAVPIVIGTTSLPCMSNPEVHPESATKIPTN
jgi:predicted helicase